MKATLSALLLLGAALASAGWKPPKDPDVDRVLERVLGYYRDAGELTKPVRSELQQHAWDAWEASAKVARRYGYDRRRVFRLYADVAMIEGRFRVRGVHDGGEGLGPVAIQLGEIDAAAARAGILRENAAPPARRRLHERAWGDRTLIVWLSVDHIAHRVAAAGGDVRLGNARNHCGACRAEDKRIGYQGAMLVWHEWFWSGEQLPFGLAPPPGAGYDPALTPTGGRP